MSLETAIRNLAARFRGAGIANPELDAKILVLHGCGLSREDYFRAPERKLTAEEARRIQDYESRRLHREPVSRICGAREFWGRDFVIGPAVLDPRADTETLVETVLDILREERRADAPLRILDLGTGSGCILLSLLGELPRAWGLGVDLSIDALAIARANARRHSLDDRSAFFCGNWLSAVKAGFDLIVSNPPYISGKEIATLSPEVRDHDPLLALDGGNDGLGAYRAIASQARSALDPGGWLAFEAGINQSCEIVQILDDLGWQTGNSDLRVCSDLAGINRVVAIKRQREAG